MGKSKGKIPCILHIIFLLLTWEVKADSGTKSIKNKKKNKKGKKETLGFYFLFPLKKQDMFSGKLVYYQKFCWMENCSY